MGREDRPRGCGRNPMRRDKGFREAKDEGEGGGRGGNQNGLRGEGRGNGGVHNLRVEQGWRGREIGVNWGARRWRRCGGSETRRHGKADRRRRRRMWRGGHRFVGRLFCAKYWHAGAVEGAECNPAPSVDGGREGNCACVCSQVSRRLLRWTDARKNWGGS